MSLDHPFEQSVLLPFALSAALAGVFRLLPFPSRRNPLCAASVGLAFLAVTVAMFGPPTFPPGSALHKLPYLVATGLLAGLGLDLWQALNLVRRLAIGVWLLLALVWLAIARLRELDLPALLTVACTVAVALLVLVRLERQHVQDNVGLALVSAAGLGLAGVAIAAASAALFQLALALVCALAGFAVWNWPRSRDMYGSVLLMGGAGTLLILGAQMIFFSTATPWAFAMLLLVFLADLPARRLAPSSGPWRHRLLPGYVFLVGLLPAGLALLIAIFSGGPDDAYF